MYNLLIPDTKGTKNAAIFQITHKVLKINIL